MNAAVHLFMKGTQITVETQTFLYSKSNLIADVGGYLGLFLGMSIFSGVQVFLHN
jgi:hypothetical protein